MSARGSALQLQCRVQAGLFLQNPESKKPSHWLGFFELVPRRRLELPRPCGHQHLKLACLP
ncbi:hypothetical protein ABNM01_25280, partial [Pseudomonas syringae]